jgi:hypothetical protein
VHVPDHQTSGQVEQENKRDGKPTATITELDTITPTPSKNTASETSQTTTGALFTLLESHRSELGIEHYTVSPNTFDEVFVNIVRKHNIDEEDFPTKPGLKWKGWKRGFVRGKEECGTAEGEGGMTGGGERTGEGEGEGQGRRLHWKWKWLLWPWFQ